MPFCTRGCISKRITRNKRTCTTAVATIATADEARTPWHALQSTDISDIVAMPTTLRRKFTV
jgi:hypothetical protein